MDWQTRVLLMLCILGAVILMYRAVRWAKKMPKGAFLFMALMPLIALFPIPPPQFKNIAKAKQEQRKKQKSEED
ncbi:hypothetical protein [Pseudoalteromonas luteoviolacea]|uniref:Uncharacterized protein n=1 Tax=Pseudoalteromonas luteoviolacea H33 TaxID=1365251 RepID=A0A167G7Q2_9GAMM|nr:hypothetical protein [Pseudoalteromonas luteoviolacea]KZN54207.1 hypothetical protein N476_08405 [Pseudoalteromonas luteoviolacea H33]KZN78262.1 hypothetical protein N477_09120 [Pseudoalteromonas luteoviolacea H33-S]MBQ4877483.1 hypothetical protein [Pseudoalteromonas luteoviolacea]MBQ4906418.1 hypothetical protein [Pseudoalteromonas luteoviolacea]